MEKRKKVGVINLLLKFCKLLEKIRTFVSKLIVKVPSTRLNTLSKIYGFISTKSQIF